MRFRLTAVRGKIPHQGQRQRTKETHALKRRAVRRLRQGRRRGGTEREGRRKKRVPRPSVDRGHSGRFAPTTFQLNKYFIMIISVQ